MERKFEHRPACDCASGFVDSLEYCIASRPCVPDLEIGKELQKVLRYQHVRRYIAKVHLEKGVLGEMGFVVNSHELGNIV